MPRSLEDLKGYATDHLPTFRSIEIFEGSLRDEETRKGFNEALLQMYFIGARMGKMMDTVPGWECYEAVEEYLQSKDRKDFPKE